MFRREFNGKRVVLILNIFGHRKSINRKSNDRIRSSSLNTRVKKFLTKYFIYFPYILKHIFSSDKCQDYV